jgi:predicted Zn-dependent protease
VKMMLVVAAVAAALYGAGAALAAGPPGGLDQIPVFGIPAGGHEVDSANDFGGKTIALYRADGSLFAKRIVAAVGGVLSTDYHFVDGSGVSVYSYTTSPATTRHVARSSGALASCGNDAESWSWTFWASTMNWYWNQASTPGNLDLTLTLSALRNARVEWESVVSWCAISDLSTMNFTYQGTTTAGYGKNGLNTVGWGDMTQTACYAQNVNTIGCTVTWSDGASHIYEADTRLKASANWANNGSLNYLDVQSVMAHETGHAIGFGDVNDSTNVMWSTATVGNTSNRKLGNGDAREDNSWY